MNRKRNSRQIKTVLISGAAALLALFMAAPAEAGFIQADGEDYIAFEAETFDAVGTDSLGETWAEADYAGASGGKGMQSSGAYGINENLTANNGASLSYTLTFKQAGTYTVYARTAAAGANARKVYMNTDLNPDPNELYDFSNIGVANNSTINWMDVTTAFSAIGTMTVLAEDVGTGMTFQVNRRHARLTLDRFVLSTSAALTDGELDALTNSEPPPAPPTEAIMQGVGTNYLAFEAETFQSVGTDSLGETWNEADYAGASGGKGMQSSGTYGGNENLTANNGASLSYTLRFKQAGSYTVYARTAAGGSVARKAYMNTDLNVLNDFSNVGFVSNGGINWMDVTTAFSAIGTLTVSAEDVGTEMTFQVNRRQARLTLDRFVLSTTASLSDSELDALTNSSIGLPPTPPVATGYAGFIESFGITGDANSGPYEDYDNDGQLNVYEYGLGGNPTNSADIGTEAEFSFGIDPYADFTHVILTNQDADITYIAEQTADLTSTNWTNTGWDLVSTNTAADPAFDQVEHRIDTSDKKQLFMRLRITQP